MASADTHFGAEDNGSRLLLKLRRIPIDTYREAVAYLPRHSDVFRPADFQALAKVALSAQGRKLNAVLNVIERPDWLAADEVGLSEVGFHLLGLPEGALISLEQAPPVQSLELVRRKIQGCELAPADFDAIIRDIADHRYAKTEIAAFLISSASFLTTEEVLSLTLAMAKVGSSIDWGATPVVDKHCIGGIPGNRTSMIIVPIVAAHGLTIPKTSSRAITSPAGTADTMEVCARVDLDIAGMRDVVSQEKGCLVWGGHVNLSPADDILIAVERPLMIDTQEQLVASILSKKLVAGSKQVVIDIPIGPSAKIRDHDQAVRLRKLFEFIAGKIGLTLTVAISDGSQPVGRGIGPVLEARDVMSVLRNEPDAPQDLRRRALFLAGKILECDPDLRGGSGMARAEELLSDGSALRKFERIAAAQGKPPIACSLGHLHHEVKAPATGRVEALDCLRLSRIARLSGAPNDKGAGIDLFKKIGDPVEQGEPLYRIHACLDADFRLAAAAAAEESGVQLEVRP